MAYWRTACVPSLIALGVGGCFNPDANDLGTEAGTASGTAATTLTSGAMTAGPDGTSTAADSDGATTSSPPGCGGPEDCAPMAMECEVASCNAGQCEVGNADAGVACGDATDSDCDAADTCDGNGACVANVVADGIDCADCASGQCTCLGGTCGECVSYADTNLFTTERSLLGWELTGDWGLYTEAPLSQGGVAAISFGNQVLGTDGNRSAPYPGQQAERSYARTPPTELPPSITFQSWHIDEGAFDNKTIRISTDGGGSWTDLISCPLNPELPFCAGVTMRAADDWDTISLDLPAPLIGQVGIIEFGYDTRDNFSGFEKGWFIDVTNFATECTCVSDVACEAYGGDCGAGVCGTNGACNLDAEVLGAACDSPTDDTCTTPDTCDGFGYCRPNNNANSQMCTECPAGEDCAVCAAGECPDCSDLPESDPFNFTQTGSPQLAGWTTNTVSGQPWTLFSFIPSNEQNEGNLFPASAPMLGIDGSTAPPLDGFGEINNADIVSRADVVPEAITFRSWHQDQGGASLDLKRIDISVDEGQNWLPLANCAAGGPLGAYPFCSNVDNRDPEDWDDISLDTSTWEGMTGQIRFSYNTVSACCGFERGWFIDDLNFSQTCYTPDLSQFVPCPLLPEEACVGDSLCGWDAGASECIGCSGLPVAECILSPVCEVFNYPTATVCTGIVPA